MKPLSLLGEKDQLYHQLETPVSFIHVKATMIMQIFGGFGYV